MKTRAAPIAIRPQIGSDLERVFADHKSRGEGMSRIVHLWAQAHVSGNLSAGPVGMKPKGRNKP